MCHFERKQLAFIRVMIRELFEMLLALCCKPTGPAEETMAARALDVATPTLQFCNWHITFRIWTRFCTMLNEQFIKQFFGMLVLLNYSCDCHNTFKPWKQIKSMNGTSFERVHSVFTIQAEYEITECTSALVLIAFDVS